MTREEKALAIMGDMANCSQAVLGAFADEIGLTEEQARGVSFCFFSGMRRADTCGACSGALMVLGMKYGQREKGDMETRINANRIICEFFDRFRAENGSHICREILGCDISTPEGDASARENGVYRTICPRMVASAARIVEELIAEND